MSFHYTKQKNRTIIVNDPIYGEFEVPKPFSDIIFTKEMQRLEKIGQNGFSIYDYTGLKNNERLSHSVGAYYLMSQVIAHLEQELLQYGILISQDDKNIAMCSMLLHDIGHGPFSHDCEKVIEYPHEKRTTDIILGDTEVNKLLVSTFGIRKTRKIASYIAEINDPESNNTQSDNFTKLLKSLIAHQLDCDRLDYLVRDSYHAGLPSAIDHKRIIKALKVSINNDQEYEVVLDESALTDIETVLFERFQRYRDVYYSATTKLMQKIFLQIVERYRQNPSSVSMKLPESFTKLTICPENINLQDFLALTDDEILNAFDMIKRSSNDPVLSHLCDVSYLKENYQLLEENVNIDDLRDRLNQIFHGVDISSTNAIIDTDCKIKIYKREEPLKISFGNTYKDLSDATNLIRPQDTYQKKRTFFNPDMLRLELGMDEKEFEPYQKHIQDALKELIGKKEEFELKYILSDELWKELPANTILSILSEHGFHVVEESEKLNNDEYYDTRDIFLARRGGSFRIRQVTQGESKKYKTTYKIPTKKGEVYTSRQELEEKISQNSLPEAIERLKAKGAAIDFDLLPKPLLNAITSRRDFVLEKNGIRVCVSFDQTQYRNHTLHNQTAQDRMIEIEALGNVNDRVILNEIHSILKTNVKGLTTNKQSKYERGIQKTRENYKEEHMQKKGKKQVPTDVGDEGR